MLMTLLLVANTALDIIRVPSKPWWFPHSLCIAETAVLYLPEKQKECMFSEWTQRFVKLQAAQLIYTS